MWYRAVSVEAAIAEVAYDRIRMLGEIGRGGETGVVYRQLLADVHGQYLAWLDDDSRKTRACLDLDDASLVSNVRLSATYKLTIEAGTLIDVRAG